MVFTSPRRRIARLALTLAWLAIVPSVAYAQASIAGVVKDTSGAVLPGVTVEAASPALIERARSVVTDGTGQYKIENLRPGTYTVAFTLPGFNTVKREGIELTGSFTAKVDADLRVGALEETVTVTGETPVVDVQSTTRQRVLDRDVIGAIPTGRNAAVMAALIPGVAVANQDVGGLAGESFSSVGTMTVHGNADVRTQVNGVSVHSAQGNGATGVGNIAAYQEMAVDTSGISAEQAEGGVRMNLIPREGGNTFQGYFYGAFANSSMQGSNFTPELKARGLGTPNSLKKYVDVNPAFGGPIARDRLWFFATTRYNDAVNYVPIFFNKNAGTLNAWTYEPDTSQGPAANGAIWKDISPRLTWQATPKNKIGIAFDYQDSCQCPRMVATTAPEAASGVYVHDYPLLLFGNWTAPLTSRLLFEADVVGQLEHTFRPTGNLYLPSGTAALNPVTEQSSGLTYRAVSAILVNQSNKTFIPKITMSYITGAHAFKVGFDYNDERQNNENYNIDSAMSFRFNNGVPNRLTLQATPWTRAANDIKRGLFVQDRWTVNRVTLIGGLRYDYLHVSFPAVRIGPGEFVPTRNIQLAAADGVRWNDLSPRTGLAYDVFGDGKTALKISLNKYLAVQSLPNNTASGGTFTTAMAPSALLVTTANRSWNDANRNFVPECGLLNPVANGECGPMDNPDFGSIRPGTTYDPATLSGWAKRPYNWQFSTGVQHELLPRVSMDVSYFRTWFGNFVVTDNRALAPSDFDSFSIAAPVDPRLPGGGGYVVSGLYDVKPNKFNVPADNYITFADNYGSQIQRWNGVDVTVNARPRPNLTLQGGTSTGRTTTDNCGIVTKVPEALFGAQNVGAANANVWLPASNCHQQSKFLTQAKLLGTYMVPRIDVQLSATLQSNPGPQIVANYVATNAAVAPSLGRTLAGNSANVSVNIVPPGTIYGERMNQLDLRFAKVLKFGRTRTTASLDLYNILNANPVITVNNSFASWQQPLSILNPRFAKIVMQLEF
jgi:hypothetical protein